MSRLKQPLQEKIRSLYRNIDRACYRFWKYPIPRRIQRVYDKACLYRKLLPSYLAVILEEFKILFTEGPVRFWFVHNLIWKEWWPRDSRPNDPSSPTTPGSAAPSAEKSNEL